MFELSQTFSFDAAHTLKRKVSAEEAAGSRRIHGHTYTAEVVVRGERQADSGMVVDLAVLRAALPAEKRPAHSAAAAHGRELAPGSSWPPA